MGSPINPSDNGPRRAEAANQHPPEAPGGAADRFQQNLQGAAEPPPREDITIMGQVGGVFKGFGEAVWETGEGLVTMGAGALRTGYDLGPLGWAAEGAERGLEALTGSDVTMPAWLPDMDRGADTLQGVADVASAIVQNPSLVWEGIKEPYVEDWAAGRYGEAIGRGVFDIGGMLLGTKGLDKLGKAGKLSAVDDLADVLTVARRADAVIPEEFANITDELIDIKRAEGKLGDLVDGARQSGTLDDMLELDRLTPDELDELRAAGKLSDDELARAQGAANRAPPPLKTRVDEPGQMPERYKSLASNDDVPSVYRDDPRFDDLAADPAHGGKVKSSTRAEAMAGLEAEAQGLVDGPIKRGPAQIEFYDANGDPWDVKTPPSAKPGQPDFFNPEQSGNAILKELRNKGEPAGTFPNELTGDPAPRRVILDSTYLTKPTTKPCGAGSTTTSPPMS
ncbi:MAG: hypothetical protein ACFCBW_14315 [Candidatus Competibacterales bacterium]